MKSLLENAVAGISPSNEEALTKGLRLFWPSRSASMRALLLPARALARARQKQERSR